MLSNVGWIVGLFNLACNPDRWTEVWSRNTFRQNCRTREREYSAAAASRSAAVGRLAQPLRKLAQLSRLRRVFGCGSIAPG